MSEPVKLNLGCGDHPLPGWINADVARLSDDILFLDATKPFPLAASSVDFIFTEHMLEHLELNDAIHALRECFRVLRPGGQIRVSIPDFMFLVGLITNPWQHQNHQYIAWAAREFELPSGPPQISCDAVVNNFVRAWGHKFIWTQGSLWEALSAVGFTSFRRTVIGFSDVPEFMNLENADRMPPGFLQLETLTIEASKP